MADKTPPQPSTAVFANVARVRHTAAEFYLDFAQLSLDQPGAASLVSALVMTPQHTKLLVQALEENIAKYEEVHGEIKPFIPPPEVVQ